MVGDGLDEVFVNDQTHLKILLNILKGDGTVSDRLPGHVIYVFDLAGDRRADAVMLTGIEPGMQMQIVGNDAPNPHPATSAQVTRRTTIRAMYNATRY